MVHDEAQDPVANEPITFLPLDFHTELPLPAREITTPDLTPPNLRQYGSPYEWPFHKKASIMTVSCISTMFASFAASSYGPALSQLTAEFHVSKVAIFLGVTMFTAGFAVGPMPLSPFSEVQGRKPVFVATAFLFLVCQVCTSVTRSYPGYVFIIQESD